LIYRRGIKEERNDPVWGVPG